MIPSREEVENYLEGLEELFFTSITAATPDLPNLRDTVQRLFDDVSRYGPTIPNLSSLGPFEIPPRHSPPSPPPPPRAFISGPLDWMGRNPWKATGIALGVCGTGILVGYKVFRVRNTQFVRAKNVSRGRREVIVVLGGDNPLGYPLIVDLEKRGFIVITSASSLEAIEAIENSCNGYVRALLLDPNEPSTIPVFLRSLAATLSRRFPLNAPGDPHASPASHCHIHSVISLLTLPVSSAPVQPAPLEHLSLSETYLPYLKATHILPLQVIQALLPLMRTNPARARDSVNGKKSIIICLPAIDARVGLPFSSVQAMSAAATLRGVEVLRREINVAALTDRSESMKNIKLIIADVGAIDLGSPVDRPAADSKMFKSMEDWTASEKLTYGPAFVSIIQDGALPNSSRRKLSSGSQRRPSDVVIFVRTIASVVTGGRETGASVFAVGLGKVRNWIRGERVSIGAGAMTYRLASTLPSVLLDILLNIPAILVSIRNALTPITPFIAHPPSPIPPAAPTPPRPTDPTRWVTPSAEYDRDVSSEDVSGSEADVESSGESGVESSWVSLKGQDV